MWMWMANYKCHCKSLQSLPSLWEITELSAEPKQLRLCSECKMLIHAAGNAELGESAVVLLWSPHLLLFLSFSLSETLTDYTSLLAVCVNSHSLIYILLIWTLDWLSPFPSFWLADDPFEPQQSTTEKSCVIFWIYPHSTHTNDQTSETEAVVVKGHKFTLPNIS